MRRLDPCPQTADTTMQGISRLLLRNLKLHIFSKGDFTYNVRKWYNFSSQPSSPNYSAEFFKDLFRILTPQHRASDAWCFSSWTWMVNGKREAAEVNPSLTGPLSELANPQWRTFWFEFWMRLPKWLPEAPPHSPPKVNRGRNYIIGLSQVHPPLPNLGDINCSKLVRDLAQRQSVLWSSSINPKRSTVLTHMFIELQCRICFFFHQVGIFQKRDTLEPRIQDKLKYKYVHFNLVKFKGGGGRGGQTSIY